MVFCISNLSSAKGAKGYVTSGLRGEEPAFPILVKGWKVYRDFKGQGAPNTYLIDKTGKVRFIHREYKTGLEKMMERQIEMLLAE